MNKEVFLLCVMVDGRDFEDCSIMCFTSESRRDEVASDCESRGICVCIDNDFISVL